jgi:hypothetical protein
MFKVNHLGKVKSSFMLDPQIFTEAKLEATKLHLTVGNIIEEALKEYLQRLSKKEVSTIYKEHMEKTEKEKQRPSTPTFNFG